MDDRYFQLLDHVGVDDAGNLEPLVEVGITIPRLAMKDGQPVQLDDRVLLKPIQAGARVFKTDDDRIADGLLSTGLVREIEKPNQKAIDQHVKTTQDASSAAATRSSEEA